MENEELYLKLPRRGKSLVAPHKRSAVWRRDEEPGSPAQGEAAVWRRDEEFRKSQIANRKSPITATVPASRFP